MLRNPLPTAWSHAERSLSVAHRPEVSPSRALPPACKVVGLPCGGI